MLRVSNKRRSTAGLALNGGFTCESVNGTITSPCASAGSTHSKLAVAPRAAAARPVFIMSRRVMLSISILRRLARFQLLDIPRHAINGVAVRLDSGDLVTNRARLINVKRGRRIVHVEHFCGLLARVARDGHRKLPLGDIPIEPRGIVIKADEDELYTFLALILL